ncbi:hypothetical protein E4U16_003404 [Claviceps sp. LM84 group G4]|nr:hypothetical protein E4U33_005641 [Claviceps sp. LM78 group G4]KAG6075346.1 hypothetical protein E4U16_003404 [Claviceps sp. LM84 group G4]
MSPDVSHQVRETSASLRLPELPLVDEKEERMVLPSFSWPIRTKKLRPGAEPQGGEALQQAPWAPWLRRLYAAIIGSGDNSTRQFDKTRQATSINFNVRRTSPPRFPSQRLFQHPSDIVLKFRMMANQADYKNREFLAVIGDEDSVTGLLLAGIGHVTTGADAQKNFLVVDSKTDNEAIESAFNRFTQERKDIGIVLINQHIADRIRHCIDTYTAAFPTVLEIPSKDHPYDPEKDSVLRRVRRLFGE